ncbi:MAG: hypothetical protein Tsb006_6080 [Rickettsiaceae bacterium]
MRNFVSLLLICIFIPLTAHANYVSNGFFVVTESLNFDKTIRSGKCLGTVPYPKLSNSDEGLFIKINDEIHDFVELYAICNEGDRDHFSVGFEIPESGTKDFFSILWRTKKEDKLWRVDSLNFNAENGELLALDSIFNIHSNHLLSKLAEISEGHLSPKCSWDRFLEKIERRDIQLYIKNDEWYIVFNSTPSLEKVVEIKVPEYFLVGRDHHDR